MSAPVDGRSQNPRPSTLPLSRLPPKERAPVIQIPVLPPVVESPRALGKPPLPKVPVAAPDPTFASASLGTHAVLPLQQARPLSADVVRTTASAFAQKVTEPLQRADEAKNLTAMNDRTLAHPPLSLPSPLALDLSVRPQPVANAGAEPIQKGEQKTQYIKEEKAKAIWAALKLPLEIEATKEFFSDLLKQIKAIIDAGDIEKGYQKSDVLVKIADVLLTDGQMDEVKDAFIEALNAAFRKAGV